HRLRSLVPARGGRARVTSRASPSPEKTMTVTEETPVRGPGRLAAAWRSGPLSVPGFRLLTFGQFASTIGDYCYAVALPWLVLSGGGSAASLGIVLACYGVPRALLTVPGGALTDRFSPRLAMLSAGLRPLREHRGARRDPRVAARRRRPGRGAARRVLGAVHAR